MARLEPWNHENVFDKVAKMARLSPHDDEELLDFSVGKARPGFTQRVGETGDAGQGSPQFVADHRHELVLDLDGPALRFEGLSLSLISLVQGPDRGEEQLSDHRDEGSRTDAFEANMGRIDPGSKRRDQRDEGYPYRSEADEHDCLIALEKQQGRCEQIYESGGLHGRSVPLRE